MTTAIVEESNRPLGHESPELVPCSSCGKKIAKSSKFCDGCGLASPVRPDPPPSLSGPSLEKENADVQKQTRQVALFLHLSLLAGYIIPYAGFIVPIIIWQVKKTELPLIDEHGKNAVNWIISEIIYSVICFILTFVLIGAVLGVGLGIIGVVLPIIAAIKGYRGEAWKYPMAIPFFSR